MNILISGRGFDSPGHHETGLFEWDQAKALAAAGHNVRFSAVDTRGLRHRRPQGVHKYELDGITVYYGSLPQGRLRGKAGDYITRKNAENLWKAIDSDGWRPDVVHAHFGASMLPGARKRGIPCVYTEHYSKSSLSEITPEELRRELETYPAADRLLCVSRPQAENIRKNTGYEAQVVHNIVDTAVFSPGPRAEHPGEFRFAAAGNLIHRKGYDLLLDAFAELRKTRSNITLTILGGGEEQAALEAQAKSLGIDAVVRFLGRQDRSVLAAEYRAADAFVLPSRMETFGVVYIEAMAAGLPVIATVCGGPEDFVEDFNGILIPVEDTGALLSAMDRMVENIQSYDRASIATFASGSFSPAAMAERLETIYRELITE